MFEILERDPFADISSKHYGNLEDRAYAYIEFCGISNALVSEAILINFKLLFIREHLISKTVEEKLVRELTNIININYILIIEHILTVPQCTNHFLLRFKQRDFTALKIFREICNVLKQQHIFIVSAQVRLA